MAESLNYGFQSPALTSALRSLNADQNVVVTRWRGTEGVSQLYRFEITLAIKSPDVQLEPLLNQTATLTAKKPDGTLIAWNGIVTEASQEGCDDVYDFYKLTLEPRLARLRSWFWSDIYLNKQLDEIIVQLLQHAQLSQPYTTEGAAYDYHILATNLAATRRDFVCQFDESCLDFLMRQLEFYGVYFWFEQNKGQESIVFANSENQQPQEAITAVFYPKGEINADAKEIAIKQLNRHTALHPKTVTLHDSPVHNNTTINLTSTTNAVQPATGLGEHHAHTSHFEQLESGNSISATTLATWRSQELVCESLGVSGESLSPGLAAGRALTAYEYNRQGKTSDYYITQISHEGYQTLETSGKNDEPTYRGQFTALPRWQDPASAKTPLQFRPARATPVPHITSMVNGFVDTGTAGDPKRYAQLDDLGRYKVRFCFARQPYNGTHNSAWLRMATPYAGGAASKDLTNAGMHFPLREGTEVLITFINGDPDRPVIVSALPNVEAPSVINSANSAEHLVVTPAGNKLAMRDAAPGSSGAEQPSVLIGSPTEDTWLNLGKSDDKKIADGFHLKTKGHGEVRAINSMWINVPGHLSIRAGRNAAGGNLASSIVQGLPLGVSVGATGGFVTSNYFGANIQSTEGLAVNHFLGFRVTLTEGLTFETNATAGLRFDATKIKTFSTVRETNYKSHTFKFIMAKWSGGKWETALDEKSETVTRSSTTSVLQGPYNVEATSIEMKARDALATKSSLILDGKGAKLHHVDATTISGDTSVTLTGGTFKINATRTPATIDAAAAEIKISHSSQVTVTTNGRAQPGVVVTAGDVTIAGRVYIG